MTALANEEAFPQETKIYYSKRRLLLFPAMMTIVGLIALYFENTPEFGPLLIVLAGIFLLKDIRKILLSVPLIGLSNKAISIRGKEYDWSVIRNEVSFMETLGTRHSWSYLTFDIPSKSVKVDIKDCDVSVEDMNRMLVYYRSRSAAPYVNQSKTNDAGAYAKKLSFAGLLGRYVGRLLI